LIFSMHSTKNNFAAVLWQAIDDSQRTSGISGPRQFEHLHLEPERLCNDIT
jgi:hypothetical protein